MSAERQQFVWSQDRQTAIARTFGKSVASAGHAQLRGMLAYKCTASGRQFLKVPSKYSTRTCSACGGLSGPTGYAGLSVRQWTCTACGAAHDRDVNAAINTLIAGVGITLEHRREAVPGIPALEGWGGSRYLQNRAYRPSYSALARSSSRYSCGHVCMPLVARGLDTL